MSEDSSPASQHEVNKTIRVLQGVRLKFTCRVLFRSGEEVEFQTDEQPNLHFDEQLRETLLRYDAGGIGYTPLASWKDILVFRCEKNP
jgi:hypothetical protein